MAQRKRVPRAARKPERGEQRSGGQLAGLGPQGGGLPDRIAERSAVLDAACEAAGRDPDGIARSAQARLFFTDTDAEAERLMDALPRPVLAGTVGRLRDVVAAYAEAGLDELIVPDFTLGSGTEKTDALDRFAEEVVPAFR